MYGSEAGTPIEVVVQRILDEHDTGLVAAFDPDPGILIHPYRPELKSPTKLVDDLLELVGYSSEVRDGRLICRPIGPSSVAYRWGHLSLT